MSNSLSIKHYLKYVSDATRSLNEGATTFSAWNTWNEVHINNLPIIAGAKSQVCFLLLTEI